MERQHLIFSVLLLWSLTALSQHNAYTLSKSGEIRGTVKYDDLCKEDRKSPVRFIRVFAFELDGIARGRAMSATIENHDFVMKNRVPYKDYKIVLEHVPENYIIQEKLLPAYNSPEFVTLEFDCETLMSQIWDAKRERSKERAERQKEKALRQRAAEERRSKAGGASPQE